MACRSADTRDAVADAEDAESARQFVQAFYDWYMPLGNSTPATRLDSVVASGPQWFTPILQRALQRDDDAQRNAADIVSVVGDFDPFLNAQDPCPHDAALAVVPRGTGWQVTITAQCESGVATPAVLGDVVPEGTGSRFANFRMSERPTYDLVSQLGAARAMRDSANRSDQARSIHRDPRRSVRLIPRGQITVVTAAVAGL
jgi:hypothetical protein